ncbi:unnamed protein product [Cylindrotheca closterium]|uniref:G-protein coupled receptors family 3 profile domain-containing protein n=1 Tax=Cylindrotheca closterium TaxID=2856 RepID=A0AAD2JNX4_9STRA|nr:unnamed protein product [Cylindrotheca closterium]
MSIVKSITLLLGILPCVVTAVPAECWTDTECIEFYGEGSTCLLTGQCSNPFMDGCLKKMNSAKNHQKRHCNSDDADASHCRLSPFNYPEIRVHNQDWVVAIFFSWILQVSLMELLDVPVTVGLGDDTIKSSFYHIENDVPYSKTSYAWDALQKANELGGNCLLTDEDCAHVIPDVWLGQQKKYQEEYDNGQLDYLGGNGQVGKVGWWIPNFTAARHPFAITHMGLSQDRHRLAEVFKRPTTWADYCHEVSLNNCTTPDEFAAFYPAEEDMSKYFASGYIGHFRATEENDCVANNNTCTGHITGAPCTWSTFVESQAYWNNIALMSSGNLVNRAYTYSEMIQIWNAANATKSDVIMWWYEPDSILEMFRNTDAAFTKVHLPSPSIQCLEARALPEDKCDANPIKRLGPKEGSCDNQPHVTKKAIAISLRDSTLEQSPEDESPAYSFIRNFAIDELEVSTILQHFVNHGGTGYAAREAVCGWIANNTDYLESFIPPNHPRAFQSRDDYSETVSVVAYIVATLALVYILISTAITVKKRKAAVFVYSQVQFIFVVLFGLTLVAIGSILHAIEPNDTICMARVWLVSLGYTFELVPLIIKVTALNRLMSASRRMRRVNINMMHLYSTVLVLSGIVAIYLLVWTVVDPAKATEVRRLEEDSITISSHWGCRSESEYWGTAYTLWEGVLILWCSALAFQSRNAKQEFNESKSLGMMVYSHFVFTILRIIVSVIFENDVYTNSLAHSYLLSLDLTIAVTIYLLPKMVMPPDTIREVQRRRTSTHLSSATRDLEQEAKRSRSSMSGIEKMSGIEEQSDDDDFEKSTSSSKGDSDEGNHANDTSPYWTKARDAPRAISKSVPIGPRRVTFKTDVDNEELKEKLVMKDKELKELKEALDKVQKTRDRQESKIGKLVEAVGGNDKLEKPNNSERLVEAVGGEDKLENPDNSETMEGQ